MKTEKRLTMALSVLVALMMLAVPLASSSNLFVDGGQTNSNGDAPTLGADATGYTITFKLNADGKSLDQVDLNETLIDTLGTSAGETWFINEDGDLCAYVKADTIIQKLINDLYKVTTGGGSGDVVTSLLNKGEVSTGVYAYTLNSWKTADGKTYSYADATSATSKITSSMVFSAEWTLNDGFVKVPVIVTFDGETKEYEKAYKYTDNTESKIEVNASYFNQQGVYDIMGVNVTGQFVNKDSNGNEVDSTAILYTFTAKDSAGKDLRTEDSSAVTIGVANNSIILEYTLKSIYTKVVIDSIIFEENVILYANAGISYSFNDVFTALQKVEKNGEKIFIPSDTDGKTDFKDDGSVLVNNEQYKATTWNGDELLYSTNNAGAELTLDAVLNSYKVIFMVNGQYEIVNVPFGELSPEKCTLDTTGINRWVVPNDLSNYSKGFKTFNFTDEEIKTIEDSATDSTIPTQVIVAVFTPGGSTAYAVFDANDLETKPTTTANFGDELVKKIIVPGKDKASISKLSVVPQLEGKNLFMGWKSGESSYAAFDSEKYDANKVQVFCADWLSYNASITFNGENGIDGVFYYESGIPDGMDFIDGMSALSYNGKIYASESSLKMVIEILSGSKDGYCVNLWKDVDGNVVIKDVQKLVELLLDAPKDESESTLWEAEVSSLLEKILDFKDLNGDVNFYAEYEAKTYNIVYNSTFNNNNQVQKDLAVDAKVSLYGEVFLNEGFKLLGWTTSAGSSQVEYELEGSFTLSGADYEKLVEKNGSANVNMYPVWEKLGSGSGTGGNTGGDNDNTALYLIAGMLAVIAILAIVGILLMRRK